MQHTVKLTTLATAALLITACGSPGNSGNGRTLTIGASQEPPSLNFWTESSSITSEIGGFLYRGLVYVDENGKTQPDLAAEVPSEANGRVKITRQNGRPVRMTVRWTLRDGAKWSDGKAISTDDVLFSHKVYSDTRLPVPTREGVPVKIEKIDNRTFVETYDPPYLFYNLGNVYPIMPKSTWQAVYDRAEQAARGKSAEQAATAFSEAFQNSEFVTTNGANKIVTSGPFKLEDWKRGQSLTMVRNPNFYLKSDVREPAGRVTYLFFGNANTLITNVISGKVDAVSSVGVPSDPQTLKALQRAEKNFEIDLVPQSNWEHIDLNKFSNVADVKALGLDDKRTRQALMYAINRRGIAEQVLGGLARPSNVYVNSASPFYLKQADQAYPYSPTKAKQMLASLGWKPGQDGILTRNGKRFVLEYVTTAGRADREKVQQYVRQNLRQVGIDVKINNAPAAVVFDDAYFARASEGKWRGMFMFTWNSQPLALDASLFATDDPTTNLRDDFIPTSANGYSGQNIGGWRNAEFQRLWEQSRSEFDESRRKQLFARMQEIMLDEVPAIPLFEGKAMVVHKKGLENYSFNSFTRVASWNAWNIGWNE